MKKLLSIRVSSALMLAIILFFTVILLAFGRSIMLSFDISPDDVEASMGGYITSMLGAILGTLLALIGAVAVQERQKKREEKEREKSDARILYFDLLSSLGYSKLMFLHRYTEKEKPSSFDVLVRDKLGISKITSCSELLAKESRAEIISSLVRLSFEEQTYLIGFISAVDYSSRLQDNLYDIGIKKQYEKLKKDLEDQHESRLRNDGFDVYERLTELTATYHLSVAIALHLSKELDCFLDSCADIPEDVKKYIVQYFTIFLDYDLSEAMEDTLNHYHITFLGFKDGAAESFEVNADEVSYWIDRLIIVYDEYLAAEKESREKLITERGERLLAKYGEADVLGMLSDVDSVSLNKLSSGAETWQDAAEIICSSYKEGRVIAYRKEKLFSGELCDYFDFKIAHCLYPDIRKHLKFLQETYAMKFEGFPALREYVYNIDLNSDIPDRMQNLRKCLMRIAEIAGISESV